MLEQHIKQILPEDARQLAYIGELPSAPQDVIAIIMYDGVDSDEYFAAKSVHRPVVKMVIRNRSYEIAQQLVASIKHALHRYQDDYFLSILMRGYPLYLGKDVQKLHEFQIVFNIQLKE